MESMHKISANDAQKTNLNFQLMFKSYIYRDVNKIKEIEGGRILFYMINFLLL